MYRMFRFSNIMLMTECARDNVYYIGGGDRKLTCGRKSCLSVWVMDEFSISVVVAILE